MLDQVEIRIFTNGKIYVGQDSFNRPNYFGSGLKIKRSINKHGIHNFIKTILFHCDSDQELDKTETYWISKLDATDDNIGYNIQKEARHNNSGKTIKFKKRKPLTDAHKKKISIKATGRKQSEETIDKIVQKNTGRKYGPCSEERKLKIGNARKLFLLNNPNYQTGNKSPNFGKPAKNRKIIQQFTSDGEFIKEFVSLIAAHTETGFSSAGISLACKGINGNNLNMLKGFIWKFKN